MSCRMERIIFIRFSLCLDHYRRQQSSMLARLNNWHADNSWRESKGSLLEPDLLALSVRYVSRHACMPACIVKHEDC
jgi:hypothetical protein